jgi:sorbitol-specific phosphotransferase system component IIBC
VSLVIVALVCMLVYLLSSFLGFGADLLRGVVLVGSRWRNRLVSSHYITYFRRSMFEQV